MTAPAWFRPWLAPAALFFALVCAAALWNRDHRQLVAARKSSEAAQLKLAGQIVEKDESAKALKSTVADLLSQNADLRAAYEAAQRVAPDAKSVYAGTFATGKLTVKDAPRSATIAATGGSSQDRSPAADAPSEDSHHEQRPGKPQDEGVMALTPVFPDKCVLAAGDQASISVQQIALQTKAGNIIAVGTAAAFRESPGPRTLLFGGPFTANASDVAGLAQTAPPRWGVGGGAACFTSGCVFGPALAFPPLKVFGFQLESTASLLVGAQAMGLGGTAIIRW